MMNKIEGGFTTKDKDANDVTKDVSDAGVDMEVPFDAEGFQCTNPKTDGIDRFASGKRFNKTQIKFNITPDDLSGLSKENLKGVAKRKYDIDLNIDKPKSELIKDFISKVKNIKAKTVDKESSFVKKLFNKITP